MSILSKATSGRIGRPQKVVIYAPEGFGKSTLASHFPDPLFFDVEDSTSQLDVRRLRRDDLPTLKEIETALGEVAKAKPCATLVVDTIDWLEQMAVDAIIADARSNSIKGIEDFGYGKGYTILREKITILLSQFDRVISSGINVVLLAHSKVVKFEPPDGAGPYDRYEMKLTKQVGPLIKEWCDALLFGNWRVQVSERDTKKEAGAKFKGVGGRERLMYCNRTAALDAKNRHGLGDTEKWDDEVIRKVLSATLEAGTVAPAKTGDGVAKSDAASEKTQAALKSAPQNADTTPVTPPPTDDQKGIVQPEEIPDIGPEIGKLAELFKDVEKDVDTWLIVNNKIKAGQTWRNMEPVFRKRVLDSPNNFLNLVKKGKA